MIRSWRFWLGMSVSLVFLGLFLYRTDFSLIVQALGRANYVFILPAAVLYFVGGWFRAVRWHYLMAPVKRVSLRQLFSAVVIGYMANDVLPLRAGELVRAYILGEKERLPKAAVLGTIAMERTFDGLTLLFLMLVVSLFTPLVPWLQDIARIMTVLFVGAFVFLAVIVSSEQRAQRLAGLLLGFLPYARRQQGSGLVSSFLSGLKVVRSPGKLAAVFGSSVMAWLIEATIFYIVTFAFDLKLTFPVLVLATATANLAITLPSSQGGIGPFEFFAAQTIVLFGADVNAATAYAVVLHAVILLPVTVLGFVYLWLENLSLAEMVQQPKKVTAVAEDTLP